MTEPNSTSIPYGYCRCGCGEKTALAPKTYGSKGIKAGEPQHFVVGHHRRKRDNHLIEDRGHESPCWIWQGATRPSNGGLYGTKWRDGRLIPAHRYYYEQEHGVIEGNLHLDHLCRVTLCVRPSHLEAVSVGENVRRGRLSKLTHEQIAEIHQALRAGETQNSLAKRYGIHVSTISRIKRSAKSEQPSQSRLFSEQRPVLRPNTTSEIPRGYCQCGCGQQTRLATTTMKKRGWQKGEPLRYIHGHNAQHQAIPYLEEDRGHDTPCWIWQGSRNQYGYGTFVVGKKRYLAHRYYYEELHGTLPKGIHLHHLCYEPACSNPDHLQPLSPEAHARIRKTTKLSSEQVAEMKRLYTEGGNSYRALGKRFGVATMTAYQAVNSS